MSEENRPYGIRDSLGRTPLHLAAEDSDVDKMEELVCTRGFDVNAQNGRGNTPMHCLFDKIIIDDLDKLKRAMSILLENGADLNIKDKFQDTPLHAVFYSYDNLTPEIIRFLLTNSNGKFNIEAQNNVGYTVFYRFLTEFHESLKEDDNFSDLIQQTESFINDFMDGTICTPCPVKRLLNMKDSFGCSAFQLYVNRVDNNIETIKKMIKFGADVNTMSKIGVTPLMDVVLDRVAPIAEVLLKSGANVNNRDIFGQTALYRVLTKDCFDLLKQYGADFTIRDKFGRPPITDVYLYTPEDTPRSGVVISEEASQRQPLYQLFLENGVSVRETDNFGSSLLHYAAWYGAPIMASALIDHGVSLAVVDNDGISPAELAKRVGNYELCSLLSGNPNEVDFKDPAKRHYVNLLIYHEDVSNIDNALHEVLDFRENPSELLKNLINSPRMGLAAKEPEAYEVKNEILKLMNKIAISIGRADPEFRCTVFPTGSSEDGSKIGEADEFDFTFCLDFFSEECAPYQDKDTLNSGFATLKLKSFHESHPLVKYTTDEYVIESYIVRDSFQDLFTSAVNEPEIWNQNAFYFDGLLNFPLDKPILNMEVHWCGRIMKSIIISIDVVPAVRTGDWIPMEMRKMDLDVPVRKVSIQDECFLLFQPPEMRDKQRRKYLRISRFSSEVKFLKSLSNVFLESYAAAKVLICDRFCPRLLFMEDLDIEQLFCESSSSTNGSIENIREDMASDEDEFESEDVSQSSGSKHSHISDAEDLETCSGIIQGTILFKQGALRDLTSCVVEIDQTLRGCKLFVPKESVQLKVSDLSFSTQNRELTARMCTVIRSIQKDTSRWIMYGPSSNIPKNETLDAVIMDSLSREENQNLTVAEWLTCTFPSIRQGSGDDIDDNTEMDQTQEDGDHIPGKETTNENSVEFANISKEAIDERSTVCPEPVPEPETETKNITWEGGEIVDAYDTISSYMLKSCLFYVAVDLKDNVDINQLDITIKLFEKLGECADVQRLDSFFLPYLDVFTFANEHIKLIPKEEISEKIQIQCRRIKLFCEVVLGILKQNTRA